MQECVSSPARRNADVMLAHASVFPGSVWADERQRPLHMLLFRPGLLRARVRHRHPEVWEEERQLPAGHLSVAAAVQGVENARGAVLRPQAEEQAAANEKEESERVGIDGWMERERGTDGLSVGSQAGQGVCVGGAEVHRMCLC